MADLAASKWMPAITAIGTGTKAGGELGSGIVARNMGDFEQQQANINAGQVQAAAQRTAITDDRRTALLASRAQAVAAASGGGATDPTVTDIMGRIAGEGAYRSQLALYEGADSARSLLLKGQLAAAEGRQAQRAGYANAFGTVLKGGATFLDKYGGSTLFSTDA